jgi:hypothetical protein
MKADKTKIHQFKHAEFKKCIYLEKMEKHMSSKRQKAGMDILANKVWENIYMESECTFYVMQYH